MFITPAPGRTVLDPETLQPLAETGAEKPADVYWLRRIVDGDVIEFREFVESIELKPPNSKNSKNPINS